MTCTYINVLQRSLIISKVAKDASTPATGNGRFGGVAFTISPNPTDGVGTLQVTDDGVGDQFAGLAGKVCVNLGGTVSASTSTSRRRFRPAMRSSAQPKNGGRAHERDVRLEGHRRGRGRSVREQPAVEVHDQLRCARTRCKRDRSDGSEHLLYRDLADAGRPDSGADDVRRRHRGVHQPPGRDVHLHDRDRPVDALIHR